MSHPSISATGDPYRYGVYLRPDPQTCHAVTTLTGQLRAQYGFVSAGAFPPHATLIGSQHFDVSVADIIGCVSDAVKGLRAFTVHNSGIRPSGVGFVFDVNHLEDQTTVNTELLDLADAIATATAPLLSPAPNPRPATVFSRDTFVAHLSLASHDLYARADLHDEVGEYLNGISVQYPQTFRGKTVALYRTESKDWTGRWWQTLTCTHLKTWQLED